MTKARILLADDDPDLLKGIARLLEPEFEVIASVKDGHGLIEAAQTLVPDLIVADIAMPRLSGFHAVRRIQRDQPDISVIFLTVHSEPAFISEARRLAASGYVNKLCIASHLVPAIRGALQHGPFVCALPPTQ